MKILQICNKVPFPPKDGGCLAMNNLTQGLFNEGHQVDVLAINTPKHVTEAKDMPAEYRTRTNIQTVFIDTTVKVIPAFLNLFSSGSYNITRFYSEEFEQLIIQKLKENKYDIIQLESLYVTMYIPAIRKHSDAKIVLRAHNVEHKILERNALTEKVRWKKNYFAFLSKRLKKYESSVLPSLDGIAAITSNDAEWFQKQLKKKPVIVIPFGIDLSAVKEKQTQAEQASVFHIGAMDWHPNIEGLNWFLGNVWDQVIEKHPGVKLYLAGRNMSPEFMSMNKKNVVVVGEVEDAHGFMRSKGLMIIPLLSGGGMRVKLIEGMSLGKVIVTTTVGAEGVDCRNEANILIADTAKDFADTISRYLSDPEYLADTGKNAKQFALQHYNNADISKRLTEFYRSLTQQ
jgi:glycosyltransferase involved in cell wall biosynthesis